MPFIEVKDIEKVYPDGTSALRGASFSIKKGEFIAIMGPSGSGKSTLLHILGFLDRHTAGTYRFDGKTIDDYSEEELARIRNKEMGFVFQAFNLLPRTSVLENVKLPLVYSEAPESRWDSLARDAIEAVGLTHRAEHDPSELSGGEKQRAAIARALVMNPNIVFADEPTGNLDSKSGEVVMETIQDLHEKGRTIILITHETYTSEYAERILHVQDGKIIKDGAVATRRGHTKTFRK